MIDVEISIQVDARRVCVALPFFVDDGGFAVISPKSSSSVVAGR